jgi:hypothetical protein
MARFVLDINRLNFTVRRVGKEYQQRVLQRAAAIFKTLLGLLPSNYTSSVQGPNYSVELKAMAVEIAKIELALEDVHLDFDWEHTRGEFLYSIVGYLVFLGGRIPPGLVEDDTEFRKFLLALIQIYFQGSIPESIRDATALIVDEDFELLENFLLTRAGAGGFDISDQFGFQINLETSGTFPPDVFQLQSALRTIIDIVRPAHTLFTIRYIFRDEYNPNDPEGRILDAMRWDLANYYYDDFRSYWKGLKGRDRLGRKTCQQVTDEDHSNEF